MIAIIDYGVGNLFSLCSSLKYIGADAIVTGNPSEISAADKIILPGVGAFGDAAKKLRVNGLAELVKQEAARKKPLLGICVGMQMLFEKSFEFGEHEGLGLLEGSVVPIAPDIPPDYKIPHIGWNALSFAVPKNPLFKYINQGEHVYFVHSYHAAKHTQSVTATTDYGTTITAAVGNANVFGTQFHPEKSGEVGLNILHAFCEIN